MAVFRDRPIPTPDNFSAGPPSRAGRYSDAYVMPITSKEWVSADEGSYFMAISPTPGTGLLGHAAPTTFDETKPYLYVYNGSQSRLYPQFLGLHDSAASTGGARVQFTVALDTGNRYSSGGTALTINNTNMDSAVNSSGVAAYAGAVVATAATATRRVVDHIIFRGTIDIVEDIYTIVWGTPDGAGQAGSRAATVEDLARVGPPLVVGPGQSLLVHQWAGAQSAGPTFQVRFGFVLR